MPPVLFSGKPSALPTCQRLDDSKIKKNESGTLSRNKSARHLRSSLFGDTFMTTEHHTATGITCLKSGQTLQRQNFCFRISLRPSRVLASRLSPTIVYSYSSALVNMIGEYDTTRHLVLLWIRNHKPSKGQSLLASYISLKSFPPLFLMPIWCLLYVDPFMPSFQVGQLISHFTRTSEAIKWGHTHLPAPQSSIYLCWPILSAFLFLPPSGVCLFMDAPASTHP